MDPKNTGSADLPADDILQPESKVVDKVREILLTLANTVSAMKIFPSEHATVRNFVNELAKKTEAFLETHDKLEIDIEEFSFTFMGKPVYRDELSIKSLPFFFYKDGMRKLFFYEGLERDELAEFLELLKRESQKPSDEGDIVTALWEKDFPSIQYYAPEEFLEARIVEDGTGIDSEGKPLILPHELISKVTDVKIDTSAFTKGKIELTREDREMEEAFVPGPDAITSPAPEASVSSLTQIDATPPQWTTLTEEELGAVNNLIKANREMPPEEEFLDLMIEVLFLEGEDDRFRETLEVLRAYQIDQIRKGAFNVPVLLAGKIVDLRDHYAAGTDWKRILLDDFLATASDSRTLGAVREVFKSAPPSDGNPFFDYLLLLKEEDALALAADVFETHPMIDFRIRILAFLKEMGGRNMTSFVNLANDARPELSREIIKIVDGSGDRKALHQLAIFISSQNRDIRLEAIHALGRSDDETAQKILAGFLKDPDEELRVQTALKLKYGGDSQRLAPIIKEASAKAFLKKRPNEMRAIFSFLGRTKTEEAFDFLDGILNRPSLFASEARKEKRLAAIFGLENMGTAKAVESLRRGSGSLSRPVREACSQALVNLASRPDQEAS